MISMCNAYYEIYKIEFLHDAHLSPSQLQVLEYILENEEKNDNMSAIAKRLSIPPSSFSKIVNGLVKCGFLNKYHTASNSKNVIVKVSDYGKQCYVEYSQGEATDVWRRIFKKLDKLDDDSLTVFIDCMNEFIGAMHGQKYVKETQLEDSQLIKIE